MNLPKDPPKNSASQEQLVIDEPAPERIGPTLERLRHARAAGDDAVTYIATEEAVAVPRMLDGNVLELLLSRGVIDSEEYACGNEFFRHWYQSGLAASGVIDPTRDRVDGGKMESQSETALWHFEKFKRMVQGVGPIHSQVLCVCILTGTSLAEFGLRHCRTTYARTARERAQDRLTAALAALVMFLLKRRNTPMQAVVGERPVIMPNGEIDEAT
jgi:hypothetical protein